MNCPHGMPSRASCVTCMEDGPVVAPSDMKGAAQGEEYIEGFIPAAQYPGVCRECHSDIVLGEPLYKMVKGEQTYYIHTDCIS